RIGPASTGAGPGVEGQPSAPSSKGNVVVAQRRLRRGLDSKVGSGTGRPHHARNPGHASRRSGTWPVEEQGALSAVVGWRMQARRSNEKASWNVFSLQAT